MPVASKVIIWHIYLGKLEKSSIEFTGVTYLMEYGVINTISNNVSDRVTTLNINIVNSRIKPMNTTVLNELHDSNKIIIFHQMGLNSPKKKY